MYKALIGVLQNMYVPSDHKKTNQIYNTDGIVTIIKYKRVLSNKYSIMNLDNSTWTDVEEC